MENYKDMIKKTESFHQIMEKFIKLNETFNQELKAAKGPEQKLELKVSYEKTKLQLLEELEPVLPMVQETYPEHTLLINKGIEALHESRRSIDEIINELWI